METGKYSYISYIFCGFQDLVFMCCFVLFFFLEALKSKRQKFFYINMTLKCWVLSKSKRKFLLDFEHR